MRGRQKGRPTKWVTAVVNQTVDVGKAGITFEIWDKWKQKRKKLGTLTASVGGVRWWPHGAQVSRRKSWNDLADWIDNAH